MTTTETLSDYVNRVAIRGACTCGRCIDAPAGPEAKQPAGHTADMIFFKVSARPDAKKETLLELLKSHEGDFCQLDLTDGNEHSYLQVGGFVGDQGAALMLMGLGSILGCWKLLTPRTLFGKHISDEQAMQMAGLGYVAIQA